MSQAFSGKIVWITGASSGIGLSLARLMSKQGGFVIGSDINPPPTGTPIDFVKLDVRDERAFREQGEAIRAKFGRIDILVNNAGIGMGGEAQDIVTADWKRILDVNVMGTVNGIAAVYSDMIKRRSGHIVNVASVAGIVPLPGEIPYVASKFAVLGLSKTLRIEAKDLGVKVTTICPGKIETPIYDTSPIVGYDKDKVLSLWPKGITPDACAVEIADAILKGKDTDVVTRFGKLLSLGQRLSPTLMNFVLGQYMKQMRALKSAPSRPQPQQPKKVPVHAAQ